MYGNPEKNPCFTEAVNRLSHFRSHMCYFFVSHGTAILCDFLTTGIDGEVVMSNNTLSLVSFCP